jgi:hypothetical protein
MDGVIPFGDKLGKREKTRKKRKDLGRWGSQKKKKDEVIPFGDNLKKGRLYLC